MFTELDYYNINNLFSEEERLAQITARDFVNDRYLPLIQEFHRKAEFPQQIVSELGKLGFLGPTLPEKYGCAETNNVTYGLIMQELERGDSGLRSFASVQSGLVMYPIYTFGSEEQRKKWLSLLASGEKIGCFGLTEADYGSNPGGMLTKAEHTADGFKLNGSKMWITNGTIADVAVVWAKLENVVRGFLVEKDTEGFSSNRIEGKFSLRASDTAELIFQDCIIPEENILPDSNGLKSPLKCLTQARFGIAWGAIGAAMACYDEALSYSRARIQFDKPISAFQVTQDKLVYMVTEITKAQLLAYQLAKLKDKKIMKHTQVSLAKRNNVAEALNIARIARTILGANGISDEYCIIRHMLNLESVYTYEGTHDIHMLVIGEDITGSPAFK